MPRIILKDDLFWKWMDIDDPKLVGGIPSYLKIITDRLIDVRYGFEGLDIDGFQNESVSMENLSLCVPREYFLEIQYCAKVYATMFGKVFPPLAGHVDQLAYIEWLLFTEPGYLRYRDHMVHMFKVAFVCDGLLSVEALLNRAIEWQFNSEHFQYWCNDHKIQTESWNLKDRQEVVKLGLFLAALFHDFGYGHFFLTKYKERLFRLYQWLLPRADPTDIDAAGTKIILRSLSSRFIQKHHFWLDPGNPKKTDNHAIAGFFHDCLPLNHSIASMFFVLDLAEKLRSSSALSEKLYVAFQLAAEACMIHDMTRVKNWLYLRPNSENSHFIGCNNCKDVPLALLLIFSDELAVWNRPTLAVSPREHQVSFRFDKMGKTDRITISVDETRQQINIKVYPDRTKQVIRNIFEEELTCLKIIPDGQTCLVAKLLDFTIEVLP